MGSVGGLWLRYVMLGVFAVGLCKRFGLELNCDLLSLVIPLDYMESC